MFKSNALTPVLLSISPQICTKDLGAGEEDAIAGSKKLDRLIMHIMARAIMRKNNFLRFFNLLPSLHIPFHFLPLRHGQQVINTFVNHLLYIKAESAEIRLG